MGQNFYIENVPGAGGNLAAAQTARAAADGYTLHVVSTGFIVNPSLYAATSATTRSRISRRSRCWPRRPTSSASIPNLPARTAQELIALVKASPGKYNYAHPGTGSTPHLNGELFKLSYGLDLTTVPFNGTRAARDLGHRRRHADRLHLAALGDADRPRRQAACARGAEQDARREPAGRAGHRGKRHCRDRRRHRFRDRRARRYPAAVVDRLNAEIKKAAAAPDVKAKLADLGFGAVASTPDEFGDRIKFEIAKWAKVIKDANIRSIDRWQRWDMARRVIGLVVPDSADVVPAEAALMYPGLQFIAKGIALHRSALPATMRRSSGSFRRARSLAQRGAAAIMVDRHIADLLSRRAVQPGH